jgi:hypothetical protein
MKPHPRIRATIKWGGAAVTLLLVVVWVGSGWYGVLWTSTSGYWVGVKFGGFEFVHDPARVRDMQPPEWEVIRGGLSWYWRPSWVVYQTTTFLYLPLWIPVALVLIPTIAAWRLDILARRRARLNLCPKCHYDRAGIVGGAAGAKCPECGASPAS